MVRKWSYLENPTKLSSQLTLNTVKKKHIFKVFRRTTRFKKSMIFPTVFYRRKDSTRKRKTNWLYLNAILFRWSSTYLKYKHLVRFYQNVSMFPTQACSPNIEVLIKRASNVDVVPWNSFTLTRKLGSILHKSSRNANPLKFSRLTYMSTFNLTDLATSAYLPSTLLTYESILTPVLNKKTSGLENYIYLNIQHNQILILNTLLITIYKCNIHLTLYTLNNK